MGEPASRISPVPPGPSLLTSARRLPAVDWMKGIVWPSGCAPSSVQEFCPADGTKDASVERGLASAMPFVIYTPVVCDVTTVKLDDVPDFAQEMTEAHTAYHLARNLWMGDGVLAVPEPTHDTMPVSLRRSSERVGTGPYDLDDGVAQLLAAYEDATDGQGGAMIHLPSILSPFALGGGNGGARICWPEGNLYRGALGSVIVPGPGYPNNQSSAGAGGHGPLDSEPGDTEAYLGNAAGTLWVYVTGPVEYDVTPTRLLPENEKDRIPFRTNRYEVWAEREAIVRFDPCSAFGALVTNPVTA